MDGMTQTPPSPAVTLSGGMAMPLVGFGTWQLRGRQCYEAVRFALETGYRQIDTATMYGNEAEVGRALAGSGIGLRDVFITTKLPSGGACGSAPRSPRACAPSAPTMSTSGSCTGRLAARRIPGYGGNCWRPGTAGRPGRSA